MEGGLILACRNNDRVAAMMINRGMDLGQVVQKICNRWSDLDAETILLSYSIIGDENITLDTDEDLGTLFGIVQAAGMEDVQVTVRDAIEELCKEGGSASLNINPLGSIGPKDAQPSGFVLGTQSDACDMVIPSFCNHEKRLLKSAQWAEGITSVGQMFEGGVEHFRQVLRKYAIERGIEYVMVKNDKERVTVHCKFRVEGKCSWEVHGRVCNANGFFFIRRLTNYHTCGHVLRKTKNPRATSELIGSLINEDVRTKSKKRPVDVVTDMKKDYGLDVTYHQAWWGVEKARGDVFGDYEMSFSFLKWYVGAAKSVNLGSHIEMEIDEETKRFKRLFVAFGACIKGFNYCRPLLFLDGTHLKGRHRGHLLAATGKDGNQGIFPLCYAVVDSENHDNWLWFLKHLHSILTVERNITFVSDRNQGLLEAVKIVFPNSSHGYCLFHLKWNLRHHLRGTPAGFKAYLVNLLQRCAYAPTQELYYENMRKFLDYGGNRVSGFISNLRPQHWANAFFSGQRYGELYSNAAESFNSWIEEERYLPIKPFIDEIRTKIMNLIVEMREIASKWVGKICPQMDKRLTDRFHDSRTWVVSESGYGLYEVHSDPTVTVDISKGGCTCQQWQQEGFPCCHAVGAITSSGKDLVDNIDPCYHSQTYRDSYSFSISPIPTMWMPQQPINEDIVLPPLSKTPPGRPKNKRIPSRGEPTSRIRCGRCHKVGNHNRKSCKEAM